MSSGVGVILYGPPAAGKDTVTRALRAESPAYQHYQRIKVGAGRREGYRFATADELERMRSNGQLIYENQAYSAVYAIDAPSIATLLASSVPIVHVGQPAAVSAVVDAFPDASWVVVDLWCPRETSAQRLSGRGSTDVADRLAVWDATPRLARPTLAIDTSQVSPTESAGLIDEAVRSHR